MFSFGPIISANDDIEAPVGSNPPSTSANAVSRKTVEQN